MPAEYERTRDAIKRKGTPIMKAKEIAAKLWNARHPDNPNPWAKEKKRKRRKKK